MLPLDSAWQLFLIIGLGHTLVNVISSISSVSPSENNNSVSYFVVFLRLPGMHIASTHLTS